MVINSIDNASSGDILLLVEININKKKDDAKKVTKVSVYSNHSLVNSIRLGSVYDLTILIQKVCNYALDL
jgi:hypothetical protein